MLYYTTLQHSPDWIWDKTKQNIHVLSVWGSHIEEKWIAMYQTLTQEQKIDTTWELQQQK